MKTCCVVCKRWDRLTGDDTLWKRLDLGLAAVPAGALSKSCILHIPLHQGVLGTVLSRGCSILRLARATVAEPIFVSPTSNQVKMNSYWSRRKVTLSQVTFPLGRAGIDSSKLSHLDLSMATISSACLASLLSSCRLLQVKLLMSALPTGNEIGKKRHPCLVSESSVTFRSWLLRIAALMQLL